VASRSIEPAIWASAQAKAAWRSRGMTWVETGSGGGPGARPPGLDPGVDIGERADGTRDRARADIVERCREALPLAGELGMEAGELDAHGGRLGVDAVAAADADVLDMLARAAGQDCEQAVELARDQAAGLLQLQGQRRVEEVGGGHAEMQEPGLGAADMLDVGQKGDDVVPRHGLDRVDRRGVDQPVHRGRRVGPEPRHGVLVELAELGHRLGHGELDLEPERQLPLGREDGGHGRPAVAGDHRGSSCSSALLAS
jgi:hypothetical protein